MFPNDWKDGFSRSWKILYSLPMFWPEKLYRINLVVDKSTMGVSYLQNSNFWVQNWHNPIQYNGVSKGIWRCQWNHFPTKRIVQSSLKKWKVMCAQNQKSWWNSHSRLTEKRTTINTNLSCSEKETNKWRSDLTWRMMINDIIEKIMRLLSRNIVDRTWTLSFILFHNFTCESSLCCSRKDILFWWLTFWIYIFFCLVGCWTN